MNCCFHRTIDEQEAMFVHQHGWCRACNKYVPASAPAAIMHVLGQKHQAITGGVVNDPVPTCFVQPQDMMRVGLSIIASRRMQGLCPGEFTYMFGRVLIQDKKKVKRCGN